MTAFLALYSGQTVNSAELIALSTDERIVIDFARRLVAERTPEVRDVLPDEGHSSNDGNKSAPRVRRG